MKDYSAISDFEINRLVARSVDGLHGDDRTAVDCYIPSKSLLGNEAVLVDDGDIGWISRDYCNNPSDAWPVIVKNKLHLTTEEDGIWSSRGYSDKHVPIDVDHANPLRAAMTVFLMMKDAEKCDG